MKLSVIVKQLQPRNPFRIARGVKRLVENVFVRVEDDGIFGYGEASPNIYYSESADLVYAKLNGIQKWIADKCISSVQDIVCLWHALWPYLQPSRAAQCALDIALYDLLGKKLGISVSKILWGEGPQKIATSYTLSICEQNEWKERVLELVECPIIKIKADHTGDLGLLRYVRSNTSAKLRVDANCSWGSMDITAAIKHLHALDVEFLEQPLPPEDNHRMAAILENSPLPILADESSVLPVDIPGLQGKFSGINIKLVKCGGLTPGLQMFQSARDTGLRMMVGCMLESNLLIAAGTMLAQKTDYADLDGSWLLTDRVFDGIDFKDGFLVPTDRPGLGVSPRNDLFD